MSIARPVAGIFLVRALIVAALVMFAVVATSMWLGPSRPRIVLPLQQTQTQSHPNNIVVQQPSTRVVPSSPSTVGAEQQRPGSTSAPDSTGGSRPGVNRFADGGPDLVTAAPAAAESTQACAAKCPPLPAR